MTDLSKLLRKETNPLNTAAKNYGSKYVLTAEEWIKTIRAIQENQNGIKLISFGNITYEPDELGLVTIPFDLLQVLLNNAGYLTLHLDISDLASKDSVDEAIALLEDNLVKYIQNNYQPKGDYLLDGKYLTLDEFTKVLKDYCKESECTGALATGLSTLEANLMLWVRENYLPSGNYLTEHQSLEGYVKQEDLSTPTAKDILDELQNKTQEEINQNDLDKLQLLELKIEENATEIDLVRSLVPEAITSIDFNKLLKESGKMYLVYKQDGSLSRIYIGTTLIAQKKNNGFLGFPYNFPIVF